MEIKSIILFIQESKMSNLHNQEQLENIFYQVIADDRKGIYDDEIERISNLYGLNQDDDRLNILQFIAENIFYNYMTGETN
jgi:hypothetical protein